MTTNLKTEIKSYLSTEKRLNNAVENCNIWLDTDENKYNMFSKQCDILESKLQSQLNIASKGLKMTTEELISEINNF